MNAWKPKKTGAEVAATVLSLSAVIFMSIAMVVMMVKM